MRGLMQDAPLTLHMALERAERLFPGKAVLTDAGGGLRRRSLGELAGRVRQIAAALQARGVGPGDRVATLAWNTDDHLEVCLAAPCLGAVLVAVNARLPPSTIAALLAHAQPNLCFVDESLAAPWRAAHWSGPVVQMGDEGARLDRAEPYEALLATPPLARWPRLRETDAAALCYTSGTTGGPRGVLYSHRSITLHALACLFADGVALRERDVCLPVVPLFHAAAWGFPYAALLAGASLTLPGRRAEPAALAALIEASGATIATGVPTVWQRLLQAVWDGEVDAAQLASLKRLPIGGAAVTKPLLEGYAELGIEVTHCWGMTELSPIGTVSAPRSDVAPERRQALRLRQGLPLPGVSLRVVNASGAEAPWDGRTAGELQASGLWAADAYYDPAAPQGRGGEDRFAVDPDGRRWLRTGDVACIEPEGYLRLVDRDKDLIKSGGEWISSIELEALLLACEGILEAAVIAAADPTWGERPVACLVRRGRTPAAAELRRRMTAQLARWQAPENFVFLDELPKTATGKIDKRALRARYAAGELVAAEEREP